MCKMTMVGLHCAAQSGNFDSIQTILGLYPNAYREAVLDKMNEETRDTIVEWL